MEDACQALYFVNVSNDYLMIYSEESLSRCSANWLYYTPRCGEEIYRNSPSYLELFLICGSRGVVPPYTLALQEPNLSPRFKPLLIKLFSTVSRYPLTYISLFFLYVSEKMAYLVDL